VARAHNAAAVDAELTKLRAEVIRASQESRENLVQLLSIYERDLQRRIEDLQLRREFHSRELISRLEVEQGEHAVAQARASIQQVRRWIVEDDILITEALAEEELAKLSRSPAGSYTVTNLLIRYNGEGRWSLADAGKIETFFVSVFGRGLPISAFGQSRIHDRLKYDHRDAMDVAIHPDSREGQALMDYLRKLGVPFIAFRGRVAGSATGAHIHVGHPSMRITQR
jgi:hypothetical protein